MITLESQTPTSTASSPLNIGAQEEGETPKVAFSELLKGASVIKDKQTVQNGAFVITLQEEATPKQTSTKATALLELLKGENTTKTKDTPLELNPQITQNLTQQELKALLKDAKNYLKDKIISSEGFKKAEIKALPKTLKGLAQVAKKFGIDVSKITIQEVKTAVKTPIPMPTIETKIENKQGIKGGVDISSELKSNITVKKTKQTTQNSLIQEKNQKEEQLTQQVRVDTKTVQTPKEIKNTPLFKAQISKEITTEQFVQAKVNTNIEVKSPKAKAEETLKMLLQGEQVLKKETGFTADFSVATARVLAPNAKTNMRKNLESLLHDKPQSDQSGATKVDGLNIAKADSFEVKLNEAKQMTKYLSQDVKTAIEDYKSPFTRVKVQLNPQRLGAVELTVVQRGKNLHISLSSNNAAINALAMNSQDLKVQLTNNGINNASLNFNNNSQGSEQNFSGQQQQNSQNKQEAQREYNNFESGERNEELVSSLEIVVPHYA